MLRTLAIAAAALAACLDASEPSLSERQDDIVCRPLCTPDYASLLEDTYSFGFRLFPDAGTLGEGCAYLDGGGVKQWDCVVTMLSPTTTPCGAVVVECRQQPGAQPPRCWSGPPDNCQ